ncbi:MAG: transcription antitermination factor NusB [Firmicutes bacterium]|nr:transcription antitermination factor NusB [Bacillota bacterium]
MNRHLAREVAFKTLFQLDIGQNEVEPTFSNLLAESGLSGEYALFARELIKGTVDNLAVIDQLLSQYLVNWQFARLAAVDRNVLRMAAYEIMYREDIPDVVAINEALEISKTFNSEEAVGFLNGVLDRLSREKLGEEE